MFPVSAGSIDTARTVWMHFGVCSIAQPHSSIAGRARANMRAAARIVSARIHVIGSAHSGVNFFTCSASASKPCVHRATNGASYSSSSMSVLSIASASASSAPGLICSHKSAFSASWVRRGSTTIVWGWCSRASMTQKRVSPSGPDSTGLWPQ